MRRISSAWEDVLQNPTNSLAAFIVQSDSAKPLNAIFVTVPKYLQHIAPHPLHVMFLTSGIALKVCDEVTKSLDQ
jgi:hypothetical protein